MKISRRELLASAAAASFLLSARPGAAQEDIQRFRINFPKAEIDDLHRRLDRVRWPDVPFDTGWSAGANLQVMRELAQYWRHKFDWFRVQQELNALPHFRTPINGEGLHFIHYRGTGSDRRFPILLIHGWPGSFVEFVDGAAKLSKRFDLVIPSLPGFVFSDAPRSGGMHSGKMGEHLHLLMKKLGYSRYGMQGGDWGSATAIEMARRYPESIAGLHLNFCTEAPEPPKGEVASEREREYRTRMAQWRTGELAYFEQQSTRPQTLAYGLTDSPVGALAWITEKFWAWSDHGDDLWKTFTQDRILTNVTLYWLTNRILSAARIYYEQRQRPAASQARGRISVPTGFARFPAEFAAPPRDVIERTFNVVHYTEQPRGGHFAAMEQPDLWASDVDRFFSSL
jgi:pimeloyl-ACP methyl ester carboxylesterase